MVTNRKLWQLSATNGPTHPEACCVQPGVLVHVLAIDQEVCQAAGVTGLHGGPRKEQHEWQQPAQHNVGASASTRVWCVSC